MNSINPVTAYAYVQCGMTGKQRSGDVPQWWQCIDWESVRDTAERCAEQAAEWHDLSEGFVLRFTATFEALPEEVKPEVESAAGQGKLFA